MRRLWRRLTGSKEEQKMAARVAASLSPAELKALILCLARTQEVELSCTTTFDLIDEYAERVARGELLDEIMPQLRQHLEMCPDCEEEFELLVQVLRDMDMGSVNDS